MAITYTASGRNDVMQQRSIKGVSEATRKATEETVSWILADDPAKELVGTVKNLVTKQNTRLFENIRFMSLYANRDFMSDFSTGTMDRNTVMPRMSDNQLKKQCDTTVGKMIQANSRVTMQTNMGDWSLWNRARKIEGALSGEWARMGFFKEAQKVCVDGFVCGTGWLKMEVSDDGKKVDGHRVFPNEVFVDEMEAAFGKHNKMYQMRYMMKDSLVALYPDKAKVIMGATAAAPPHFPWCQYSPGMIEVVEGWALPVGDRPGRHVIATSNGCLLDEEYTDHCFPFVCFKPNDAPFGFYGQGWVEQTMAAQILLNKTLNVMEQGAHYGIAPFWVVMEGANINTRHLDNVVGHVVETTGGEPKWVTNTPFHQAAPAYCQMLRQVIADFWGNNSMDTGGEVPINRIDSKKALREYQDMGASRITAVLERWTKDFFLEAAERTLMLASRIAKDNGSYPVLINEMYKKAVALDWKDLDIQRDAYLLQPAPANLLSQTPAGRTDDIKELMEAGLITQKQGQRAMQGPDDINALLGEASATEDDLDWVIEQFVSKGEYIPPSSLQDLQRGLVRMSDAYLQYRTLNLPEEKLNLFEHWLAEAQDVLADMQNQNQPAAAPAAAMIPGAENGGIPALGGAIDPNAIPPAANGAPALGALPPGAAEIGPIPGA